MHTRDSEALLKEPAVSLEETIATHLRQRGWHLALAETTTGGIIAVRLVRLAGSSAYFDRSIVAYSKEAKIQSLGIAPEILYHRPDIYFFPLMFNYMLQLVLGQKTTEHSKEQHEKIPEIMCPFFS